METDTRTETACWCTSASGLLRAFIPYGVRSFNDSLDESRKLFADKLITDVGYALQPFHEGEIVSDAERIAARRIAAGLTMDDVNGLVDELGAIAVSRAILAVREMIQMRGTLIVYARRASR